jgi:hypothetical protein
MRSYKSLNLVILVCAFGVGSVLSAGEIYRWKDPDGTWHYTDQPVPGAERISSIPKPPSARPAAETTAPARGSGGPVTPGSATPAGAPQVSRAVAAQVRAEVSAARSEQCNKARDAYTKAVQSRRIYRVGPQGERQYLSEVEADTARLAARAEMDSACGQ